MDRQAINPWPWSVPFGFNQAELVGGMRRQLFLSGQTSLDASGTVQHVGDMAGQVGCALDNLESVLAAASMTFDDVVRLTVYTTDVDLFLASGGIPDHRVPEARWTMSLVGVARLAYAELLVELEATAVD